MSGANTAVMLANLANAALGFMQMAQTFRASITVLKQAQDEGRDVTQEEMDAARADAKSSLDALKAQLDGMS